MSPEWTVSLHDARSVPAPAGWTEFVTSQRLPGIWDWAMVRAVAGIHRSAALAATILDGSTVRGLATARFTGIQMRRGAVPLGGVVDVDCFASSSLPGVVLESGADQASYGAAVTALRQAVRAGYGRRVRALLFRQVSAELLPAVLRWPAIVREGGPVAVFHNRYRDFDAYLGALSRDRRSSLRRLIRKLDADPDLAVSFTADGTGGDAPLAVAEACALQALVVARYRRRFAPRSRTMVPAVAGVELTHPGMHRLTYRDGEGGLLGFALLWDHHQWPIAGAWGARAPVEGGRAGLWFHCGVRLVRWCIEAGRPGFVSGRGSLPEKLRLGHEARRQWAVLVPLGHG